MRVLRSGMITSAHQVPEDLQLPLLMLNKSLVDGGFPEFQHLFDTGELGVLSRAVVADGATHQVRRCRANAETVLVQLVALIGGSVSGC